MTGGHTLAVGNRPWLHMTAQRIIYVRDRGQGRRKAHISAVTNAARGSTRRRGARLVAPRLRRADSNEAAHNPTGGPCQGAASVCRGRGAMVERYPPQHMHTKCLGYIPDPTE
eukprot:354775-Chlamydomonas_euryale.AAC.2